MGRQLANRRRNQAAGAARRFTSHPIDLPARQALKGEGRRCKGVGCLARTAQPLAKAIKRYSIDPASPALLRDNEDPGTPSLIEISLCDVNGSPVMESAENGAGVRPTTHVQRRAGRIGYEATAMCPGTRRYNRENAYQQKASHRRPSVCCWRVRHVGIKLASVPSLPVRSVEFPIRRAVRTPRRAH